MSTPTTTKPRTRRNSKTNVTDIMPKQNTAPAVEEKEIEPTSFLPSTEQYASAKSGFESAGVAGAKVLLSIVEAKAYSTYVSGWTQGIPAGPAELFGDFLGTREEGGLSLPKSDARNKIIVALESQDVSQPKMASMLNMSRGAIEYTLKNHHGTLPASQQKEITTGEPKVSGKAKVTSNGLVRVPSFDVTPENYERLVKYLSKMGVTVELPDAQ